MVANSAIDTSLIPPNPRIPFVLAKTFNLTTQSLQVLQQMFNQINGLVPTLTCDASGTNTITLSPVAISPLVINYVSFLGMGFVAAKSSTGPVSALLNLPSGPLATLPVYVSNGAVRADSGDVVKDSFYIAYYVDTLNSGNGGFVLK